MKKILLNAVKIVAMLILAVAVLLVFNANKGKYHDEYFGKKITKLDFLYFKEDKSHTHAFDSKLPLMVKNDMRRAAKKNRNLLYEFGENYIIMKKEENGDWSVKVTDKTFSSEIFEELRNFSIFKNKDSGLSIYGNSIQSGFFIKETVGKNENNSEVLTYNNEIPFAYKQTSLPKQIEEYYYTNTNEAIYFFKNQELVATQKFPGKIYNSYIINGGYIIANEDENKNIYKITVFRENNRPTVRFDYVTRIKTYDDYKITGIEDNENTLLLINKDGKEYIAIPDNWDNYYEMNEFGEGEALKFKLLESKNFRLKKIGEIDCLT